jgi:hypothetical protein
VVSTSGEVQVAKFLDSRLEGRSTGGNKLESRLEGRRGWFTIFHVKATKKVTSILRLGNQNSFIGWQNLEAKEIMQKS